MQVTCENCHLEGDTVTYSCTIGQQVKVTMRRRLSEGSRRPDWTGDWMSSEGSRVFRWESEKKLSAFAAPPFTCRCCSPDKSLDSIMCAATMIK